MDLPEIRRGSSAPTPEPVHFAVRDGIILAAGRPVGVIAHAPEDRPLADALVALLSRPRRYCREAAPHAA